MPKKVVATPKKVAPKKAVAKKAPAKKAAKKTAVMQLVYADNAQSFWLTDGRVLNSLLALKEALAEMEKAVFAHHVTADKNDFADWVDLVLADSDLASALRAAKTPKSAHTVVVKRLKVYQL